MSVALLCLSALLALAWLPILLQFFKNWRGRNNPISLAICFVVAFAIYLCFQPFLAIFGSSADPAVTALSIQAANTVTCLFFHISFGWAKRKFGPEDRQTSSSPSPSVLGKRGRVTDYPATVESDRIS